MTKWIVAAAMVLATAFATTQRPAPTPPAEEIATGTCSYTCSTNGKTYINRTQCRASCAGLCTSEVC